MTTAPAIVPVPIVFKLDQPTLTALAREVAMNIRALPDVLSDYGITEHYYESVVLQIDWYKRVLDVFTAEWASPMKTEERLRLGSLAILESGMPALGARMKDGRETLAASVEAAKLFAKLGRVDGTEKNANAGEKFSLTINLGEDKKLVIERTAPSQESEGPALPPFPEGASSYTEIQSLPSPAGEPAPIQSVPEGAGHPSAIPKDA